MINIIIIILLHRFVCLYFRNLYECPVYKTRQRGPTYIWTFNLRTKEKASKWVLAGASLLLQI